MTRPQDAATEALADVIGVRKYGRELPVTNANTRLMREGDMFEAQQIIKGLQARGYVIRKARKSG